MGARAAGVFMARKECDWRAASLTASCLPDGAEVKTTSAPKPAAPLRRRAAPSRKWRPRLQPGAPAIRGNERPRALAGEARARAE